MTFGAAAKNRLFIGGSMTLYAILKLPGCAIPVTSVQKLSRIILICHQAERLADFYVRAFGFACIEGSPKSDPGFAELIGLANGQVQLTTLRLGSQVIVLAEPQPPRTQLSAPCSWMGSAISASRDCSVRYDRGLCEFAGPS